MERKKKALIALDIDGTLLGKGEQFTAVKRESLESLVKKGGTLLFVSGMSKVRIKEKLGNFNVDYYYSPYNGAALYSSKEKLPLYLHVVETRQIEKAMGISEEKEKILSLYPAAGEEAVISWVPKGALHRDYMEKRAKAFGEKWNFVDKVDLNALPPIISIKWIAPLNDLSAMAEEVEERLQMHMPLIRDPYDAEYGVLQGTALVANKGLPISSIPHAFAICAGDDWNDLPLFDASDYAIAIDSAPVVLQEQADEIVERGNFAKLMEAIHRVVA